MEEQNATFVPVDPHEKPPLGGEGRRRRHIWPWIVVILIALGVVFLLARYKANSSNAAKVGPPTGRAVPVTTATVTTGDIGVYISALGSVTPVYTVSVTSRVQGQIMAVAYREGQMVRKGDLLLQIDPRPYQAALTQAEGLLAHDQAVLAESRIDYARYKSAYSRNAIPKQQLDDQEQTVLQNEGTVKNDEGNLENAKVNLAYTQITSPIDGRVGLRLVDPGNIVQANGTNALLVVTQLQPITVVFSVAEDYLPQIQQHLVHGQRMPVDAFDRDQNKKIASGSLLTLDNQIDTTTGTVKLKAVFDNKDFALFPNQFVNARLLVDTQRGVTVIPTAAIQRNAQGAFVYVVSSGQTATMHPVTLGTTDGNITAVQGVNPGNVVVVSGFDKLQDGAKVIVRGGAGPAMNRAPAPHGSMPPVTSHAQPKGQGPGNLSGSDVAHPQRNAPGKPAGQPAGGAGNSGGAGANPR
jgi:multidrug efflux system membrane fusion protein